MEARGILAYSGVQMSALLAVEIVDGHGVRASHERCYTVGTIQGFSLIFCSFLEYHYIGGLLIKIFSFQIVSTVFGEYLSFVLR
jgi:hypothetical protein